MKEREALKLALDYIVESNKSSQFWLVPASNLNKTVNAIKEVLAQPEKQVSYSGNGTAGRENMTAPTGFFFEMPKAEQEPDDLTIAYMSGFHDGKKKREWVGLTLDEIALINQDYPNPQGFALAIQAKLKEKNT